MRVFCWFDSSAGLCFLLFSVNHDLRYFRRITIYDIVIRDISYNAMYVFEFENEMSFIDDSDTLDSDSEDELPQSHLPCIRCGPVLNGKYDTSGVCLVCKDSRFVCGAAIRTRTTKETPNPSQKKKVRCTKTKEQYPGANVLICPDHHCGWCGGASELNCDGMCVKCVKLMNSKECVGY